MTAGGTVSGAFERIEVTDTSNSNIVSSSADTVEISHPDGASTISLTMEGTAAALHVVVKRKPARARRPKDSPATLSGSSSVYAGGEAVVLPCLLLLVPSILLMHERG